MANLKQQLLDVVAGLPDDCTMDDFRYRLYVRQRIEEGIGDIEAGRVYSHEEAVEMVKSWRKSSGQNPHNFLAGFEGIPSIKEEQLELFHRFGNELVARSPDFQKKHGYEVAKPGQANMSMSTAQLAQRFGAVSMTLEMPFKDNADLPDPEYGWSPDRCRMLARSCLDALHGMLDELADYRG